MAGEAQDNVWPLPSFYFKVELGSLGEIAFKEVSGLDMEAQVIEYRHGNSPVFSNIKMPGLKKTSNVSLKKGVFKADNKLFDWFNKIKMNTIQREDVTTAYWMKQEALRWFGNYRTHGRLRLPVSA